jgi:hypothetical protein
MTTLFLTEYGFGMVSASDDIVDLKWIDFNISVLRWYQNECYARA